MFYTVDELNCLKTQTAESMAEKAFWGILEEFPNVYTASEREDLLQDCYMIACENYPHVQNAKLYSDKLIYFRIYQELKKKTLERIRRDKRITYIDRREACNIPDMDSEGIFDKLSLESDIQQLLKSHGNSIEYSILIYTEVYKVPYEELERIFNCDANTIYRLKRLAIQQFRKNNRHLYDAY